MKKVKQIEEVMQMTNNKYEFCGTKLAYDKDVKLYQTWKDEYLKKFQWVSAK